MEKKPNICFVARNSYRSLLGIQSPYIGGIEIQMPMMAKWFAEKGYPVTMICWDEGYGPEVDVDGIRVISTCQRDSGIPGLRFFTPRWTSLTRALRKAKPDVIYYNYGDLEFGQIMLWARRNNVPVVYSVANNMVCRRDLPSLKPRREKLLYQYGLVRTDRIITQTEEERDTLLREYNLDSVVIPMPNPGFSRAEDEDRNENRQFDKHSIRILWVGRFTEEKRLEWFLDLAKMFPQYQFDVIGGPNAETEYADSLIERATLLENVHWHGKVSHDYVGDYYRAATLLLSTSTFEGFPNVFLEAWSVGVPVVATIDPDGIIATRGLGTTGTTLEELAQGIRRMLVPDKWQEASAAARSYYENTHKPEKVLSAFEKEILQVVDEYGKLVSPFDSTMTPLPADQQERQRPDICLVAHNAYGVLANIRTAHVGGIEVQVPLMAKWLNAHGHRATMVSWDTGYEDGVRHHGVTVRKLCRQTDGVPLVRFFHPRWTSLMRALSRANADIYYYNCGDLGLGQVALWARLTNKKVVYSIANDVDCVQSLPALKPVRERVLYRYGLRHANRIICQTERQKHLLAEEFHLPATVIRMPSQGFSMRPGREDKPEEPRKHILWAGRFTPEKRLEWFFQLAQHFPEMVFDVLGDYNIPKDIPYADRMKEAAKEFPNVVLHGRVPHEGMEQYFNSAYLLCSTSEYEGFPNIYLEAWSVGVPLVTTFDPDGVVEQFGLGRTATDMDSLTRAVRELLEKDDWLEASNKAITYFERYHSVEASMHEFERTFLNLHAR